MLRIVFTTWTKHQQVDILAISCSVLTLQVTWFDSDEHLYFPQPALPNYRLCASFGDFLNSIKKKRAQQQTYWLFEQTLATFLHSIQFSSSHYTCFLYESTHHQCVKPEWVALVQTDVLIEHHWSPLGPMHFFVLNFLLGIYLQVIKVSYFVCNQMKTIKSDNHLTMINICNQMN